MALCDSCQAFDVQSFRRAAYHVRGFKFVDVVGGAADEQCAFCHFMLDALGFRPERVLEYEVLHTKLKEHDSRDRLWVHIRLSEDGEYSTPHVSSASKTPFNQMEVSVRTRDGVLFPRLVRRRGTVCRILANPGSQAVRSGDISGIYLGEDSSSEEHYQWITSWLTRCLAHPRCTRSASGTQLLDPMSAELPTRCIEVGQNGIRLKHTAEERAAYITLSHRWLAKTASVSTCTRNLTDRMRQLDLHSLPQTFQDAVSVTRRLGIPYLWIDSLCIVQSGDGGEDWRRESLRMGQYYQNSVLTIAALEASEHGFLGRRPACKLDELVRLPYRNSAGDRVDYFYVEQRKRYPHVDYLAYVAHSELMGRGWVLQEWLLSRRVLHYAEVGIFVECQTEDAKTEFGESVRAHGASEATKLHNILGDPAFDLKRSVCHEGATTESIYLLWARIVEAYSEKGLTKPETDRIIALAGVAREIRQILMTTQTGSNESKGRVPMYVAGWWVDDIHRGLLWEFTEDYRGPTTTGSWSWNVWYAKVIWRSKGIHMAKACKVLRVITNSEYKMPSNAVDTGLPASLSFDVNNTFGCLAIEGHVRLVLVGRHLESDELDRVARYTGVTSEFHKHWRAVSCPTTPDEIVGWVNMLGPLGKTIDPDGPMAAVRALHITTQHGVPGGLQFGNFGLTHDVYSFLLLSPHDYSDQNKDNRYIRLGVGRIFKQRFFEDAEDTIIELA